MALEWKQAWVLKPWLNHWLSFHRIYACISLIIQINKSWNTPWIYACISLIIQINKINRETRRVYMLASPWLFKLINRETRSVLNSCAHESLHHQSPGSSFQGPSPWRWWVGRNWDRQLDSYADGLDLKSWTDPKCCCSW